MKIAVGTTNPGKIAAVHRARIDYPLWTEADIQGYAVSSGVADQPIGLEETIRGARQRAAAAYREGAADYGIGLESGIFPVPYTKSGYMDTTACAIYDGQHYHLGLSTCFEYPPAITKRVLEQGQNVTEAAVAEHWTTDPHLGNAHGMIGELTNQRIIREDYTYSAIQMAMIHLEHEKFYPTPS